MSEARTACYALTPGGAASARRVAAFLASENGGAHVYVPPALCAAEDDRPFESLPSLLAQTFSQYRAHVFVTAAGIAVRCIAPHLVHKSVDPAVLVCDETGHFAISLLSGHWGGGNALARALAAHLGGTAVVTTATDCRELPAVDLLAQEAGCAVVDWEQVKLVNAALLRGEQVQLHDPFHLLRLEGNHFLPMDRAHAEHDGADPASGTAKPDAPPPAVPAVSVDWRQMPPAAHLLRLAAPALHVGIGCRRGVSAEEILAAVQVTLTQYALEPLAVAGLASATLKEDEAGLVEAARVLRRPLRFFTPEELADAPTLSPSAMAAQLFGVDHISVAEGAALLSAGGEEAALLVPKTKYQGRVTVAVALPEHFFPARNSS